MRLSIRLSSVLFIALMMTAGLFAVGPSTPAGAATKYVGMPGLTPYGGYIGNYLAPDGARVYCIDSSLTWPSGSTSAPTQVDSLVTTWGSSLPASALRRLNYVLLTYGQTDDPAQAAAVAAFVNAYTSGWARDLGAGYAAGAWYLSGNIQVTGVYDAIWADAEANADPAGSAIVELVMTEASAGAVKVTASRPDATGTVSLEGAVRADTGESTFAVTGDESIPIRGVPGDEVREYVISAIVDYTAPTLATASLAVYFTAGQQRTIRGGAPGEIQFSASTTTGPIALDFSPELSTTVAAPSVGPGEGLIDRITVALAEGSRPWRVRADGTPVVLIAEGVLYGPFAEQPEQSAVVPSSARVAGTETVTLEGAGEYASSGSTFATAPGFYTWVWTIDTTRQDAVGAASLPDGFLFRSAFGLPEETLKVVVPPRRLANTGDASRDSAAVALGLIGVGLLLGWSARVRRVRE